MLGVFMGALDISIVSPALPTIAKDFGIDGRLLSWIITLYTLVYVIALPLMSALSDRHGRRRIFLINVIIFGLGSLWAAFSQNLAHLLIARGIQALGAGGLFPISSTIVGENFPKARHGMALGFIGMMWGVAAILGPLVGGWITQWFGWTTIFYVNLALAFLIYGVAWKNLPRSTSVHKHPFDTVGMIFLAIGLVSITYGLNEIDSKNLLESLVSLSVAPWFIAGLVSLGIFVRIESVPKAPIIPISLFKNHQLNIGLSLSFARGMTEAGIAFLPFYAISTLGIKTGEAGTLILATAVTLFLLTEPAGLLVDKLGAKRIVLFGALATALGAGLLATAASIATFIGYQIILGIGLSALSGAPIRYVVLHETNDQERAAAQSLVSLFSSFGIMVGSALAGSFLSGHEANATANISGFHQIYWMVTATALIGFIFALGLKSKHKQQ